VEKMHTYHQEEKAGSGVLALILGPLVGLLYVVAMPFIAIATIVGFLAKKAGGAVMGMVRHLVSFGWRPSEAYLSGKKKKKTEKKENN
jgi:hypothetical protein